MRSYSFNPCFILINSANNLEPPPANLTEPHVAVHTDGDLHWWITNGIQPAMPAFGEDLTQEEIWNVINYVRTLTNPDLANGD